MSEMSAAPSLPVRCEFQSEVFGTFGEFRFRRSETDGVPMMAISLGEREAQLPLLSMRRQFGIVEDSPDDRMLTLIGSALDYVPSLSPGDKLPTEVLTGEASWKPSPKHGRLATTRLRLNLVAWLSPGSRWALAERDEITLLRLADDQALAQEISALAILAAERLGLRDGATLMQSLDAMAKEMAYIEALRQRLLARVEGMCRHMAQILADRRRQAAPPSDTMAQVYRLAMLAYRQLHDRFDDVDAQTGEFSSLIRNAANQRQFIRTHRDWLYRQQRVWDTLLGQWEQPNDSPVQMTALLAKTYQFLAPRFMPTKEWQSTKQERANPSASRREPARAQMAW